jgi:hypothetical protein
VHLCAFKCRESESSEEVNSAGIEGLAQGWKEYRNRNRGGRDDTRAQQSPLDPQRKELQPSAKKVASAGEGKRAREVMRRSLIPLHGTSASC